MAKDKNTSETLATTKVAAEVVTEATQLENTEASVLDALGPDFDVDSDGGGFGYDSRFRVPAVVFNNPDTPGQIFNKVTELAADKMRVVFLYAQKYRDYSTSTDGGVTYTRHCSSTDARQGFGIIEESGEERKCSSCPFSKWTTDADGKRVPPPCSEGYGVAGMDMETEAIFLMRFQKTAYPAFDRLKSKYHGPQRVGNRRVKALPLWMIQYDVGVEKVERGKGQRPYYVPTIHPADPKIIPSDAARSVYDAAQLVEQGFGQILSFHRDAEPDESAATDDATYAEGQGQGFVE